MRQYLYFCTTKASKLRTGRVGPRLRLTKNAVKRREAHKLRDQARHLEAGAQRQYLYVYTSKASKLRNKMRDQATHLEAGAQRQYLYFCTSKASKLVSTCTFVPVKQVNRVPPPR